MPVPVSSARLNCGAVQRNHQIHPAVAIEITRGHRLRLDSDRKIGFRAERSVAIPQHDRHRIRAGTSEVGFAVPVKISGDVSVAEQWVLLGRERRDLRRNFAKRHCARHAKNK